MEDEMVGWHHWLDGHGSGWTPGVGDGQGGLACCGSWDRKKSRIRLSDWTELMRLSHTSELDCHTPLLLALLVMKTFIVSLLFLVTKVCTLGNYFCGWNARQKNTLEELSDVVLESTHRRQCYTTFSNYGKLSVQFSSVAQSCQTLCDPMDSSTPGFPVHHQLPESTQTHVHWVGDAIQPPHPLIPFSSCLQYFPSSGSFPMSQFFSSGGQLLGCQLQHQYFQWIFRNDFLLD